jgi:RND family efflux transporter MFP subunit
LRLDDADYQLAVTRVRAGVASAEQRLARERAEAELAQRDLNELGIVDASPLAKRLPQIAEAEANLSSAKAQLADAELQLARTVVRAPFTGRVSMKSTEVGQIIAPGQTIGRMFATDIVEVPLPLTDSQLGLVGLPLAYNETARAPGPEVALSAIVGGRSVAWTGRIVRTSAQIDARTRQVMAFAQVDDPFGKAAEAGSPLAPGLFVTGLIQGREVDDTLSIPRSALRGKDKVFVAHNEKIDIRTVSVLKASPDSVLITEGLTLDDRVITSSVMGAFDGMKISVINDMPAAAPAETAEPATEGDAQ